jgi:hypothetical protein
MRITKVEGVLLSAVLAEPHVVRWSGGEMQIANAALAVVHTDEGLTGIGDTLCGRMVLPEGREGYGRAL